MTETAVVPAVEPPQFNEANIERALLDAQGDIFVAAQLMGHVTVQKMDRAIRSSERLQKVFLAIKQVKALPEYDKASAAQLEAEITRRITIYRADGLEALHELATMDIGENSAMAQVKLAAAARLTGPMGNDGATTDIEKTLRDLNEAYHSESSKITLRRTEIEISSGPRVVDGESSRVQEDRPQT